MGPADIDALWGAVRGQAGVASDQRRLQRPPVRLRLLARQGTKRAILGAGTRMRAPLLAMVLLDLLAFTSTGRTNLVC